MANYYVQIDGKKYDRALLDAAQEATQKPRDGRISVADATKLANLALDAKRGQGENYTAIERDTVARIRENTKWTAAADRAFLERIPDAPSLKPWQIVGSGKTLTARLSPILKSHGVPNLLVQIKEAEVAAQQAIYGGSVGIEQAVDQALASFLHDGDRSDSPLMMATEIIAGDGSLNGFTNAEKAVKDLLNRSASLLQLVGRQDMIREPSERPDRVFPPEDGEQLDANWLFALHLDFSDVLHWAIVDRNGLRPTYNYGFN